MPIEATEPTVLDGTYPYWAFSLRTTGFGLAEYGQSDVQPIGVEITLAKYRVRPEDGVPERSPLPGDIRSISVEDLYALAAEDSDVATALAALVSAVGRIAASRGVT